MRKFLCLLAILLAISTQQVTAQTAPDEKTEKEVKTLICHDWQVVAMELQGQSYSKEAMGENMFITFYTNGTLSDSMGEDPSTRTKWTYDHKTRTITSGGIEKKILSISDTEMVITATMNGQSTKATLKRID